MHPRRLTILGARSAECETATSSNEGVSGWTTVGGTSAATPLLAGAVALVTQAALENDRPTPGFLTPALYSIANLGGLGVLNDVTLGDNDLYDLGCCSAGPSYDLATGWGSVHVPPSSRSSCRACSRMERPNTTDPPQHGPRGVPAAVPARGFLVDHRAGDAASPPRSSSTSVLASA